jgi:hypothetical protein
MPLALALLALLALVPGCGAYDQDSCGSAEPPDARAEDTEPDTGRVNERCAEIAWELVFIMDSLDNACDPDSPGSDIDGVELYHDDERIGTAAVIAAVDLQEPPVCPGNVDQGDPAWALGAPDGTAAYSLNGGSLFLEMSTAMDNGDTLVVYELDPEDEAEEDCFQLYLGYYTCDGDMAFMDNAYSGWGPDMNPSNGCETLTFKVDGLW